LEICDCISLPNNVCMSNNLFGNQSIWQFI
jgi:hypothetical protein